MAMAFIVQSSIQSEQSVYQVPDTGSKGTFTYVNQMESRDIHAHHYQQEPHFLHIKSNYMDW